MSKKHYNHHHRNNLDVDVYHETGYHDRLAEHRKDKRMKNAIRSKNIEDLMHLDDDEL
jgi:mevalonate pyrophosphate decarboxylase